MKRGSAIAKSSLLFSRKHLSPPGASWMKRRQTSWQQWQKRAGDTLLPEQKGEKQGKLLSGKGPPTMGTEPGNSKKCWEGLRKASQPVSELLTGNIHTLSGRKRSTEVHTHLCKHPLSLLKILIHRDKQAKGHNSLLLPPSSLPPFPSPIDSFP